MEEFKDTIEQNALGHAWAKEMTNRADCVCMKEDYQDCPVHSPHPNATGLEVRKFWYLSARRKEQTKRLVQVRLDLSRVLDVVFVFSKEEKNLLEAYNKTKELENIINCIDLASAMIRVMREQLLEVN